MSTLIPQLTVSNSLKAIDWYVDVFNAEKRSVKLTANGQVMHGELKIADQVLFINDPFDHPSCVVGSSNFYFYVSNVDTIYKKAIAAGATASRTPLSDMFWGDRCGDFVDPFGQRWTLATHIKDMTPAEIEVAEKEFMKNMKDNCPDQAAKDKQTKGA